MVLRNFPAFFCSIATLLVFVKTEHIQLFVQQRMINLAQKLFQFKTSRFTVGIKPSNWMKPAVTVQFLFSTAIRTELTGL